MTCQEELNKDLNSFLSSIKKVNGKRDHKVKLSLGVYDAYKWIRKNKWLNISYKLSEHLFYYIIRLINEYLANELLRGKDIIFPNRMGSLELRKYEANFSFNKGRLVTNLPIDWDRTLKLWYEDEEAYKNKTLIKMEEKEIFKVYYNRNTAEYNNKSFYQFNVNRDIKNRLKLNIKKGFIDAFKFK